VKLAYDLGGKHTLSFEGTEKYDSKPGFSIAGEYLAGGKGDLEYGFGVAYQAARGLVDVPDEVQYSFIPVYGLVKYDPEQIYLIGQLGYNLFLPNDDYDSEATAKGGIYYGARAGINLTDKMFAEVLYSVNNGSLEEEVSVKNIKVGLAIGVAF